MLLRYTKTIKITEQLIRSLKDLGLSRMQSIKALMHHIKLPLKEADALVLHSKAWADSYEGKVQLHDDFFDVLEELE